MFNWISSFIEFIIICSIGKIFGISFIIRYLRNPNPLITSKLLRVFGATIGRKTTFKRSLFIDNTYADENSTGDFSFLKIGNNCYIGDCVYFDLSNQIYIENDVIISGQVSLVTHSDCNRSKYLTSKFPRKCEPVIVKEGSWLCFRSTVLSGVTVGEYSVVGSNSLLKKDTKPRSIYAGLPAKYIKSIEE